MGIKSVFGGITEVTLKNTYFYIVIWQRCKKVPTKGKDRDTTLFRTKRLLPEQSEICPKKTFPNAK